MARGWKLTEQDVREIRILYSQGVTQTKIALSYDVTPSAISKICNGHTGMGWFCRNGHRDWELDSTGKRHCRECKRIRSERESQRQREVRKKKLQRQRDLQKARSASEKQCARCDRLLTIEHFYWKRSTQSWSSYCRECYRQVIRQWQRANPEKVRLWKRQSQCDRTRKYRLQQARIGLVSYKTILERNGMTCWICTQPIRSFEHLDFDHVVPLSRGGEHSSSNIRPSHAWCNVWKSARTEEEIIHLLPLIRDGQLAIPRYDPQRNGSKLSPREQKPWLLASVPDWLILELRSQGLSYREVGLETGHSKTSVIKRVQKYPALTQLELILPGSALLPTPAG